MFGIVDPDLVALLKQGFTYQQRGDFAAAEKKYRKVLKQDEANEFALNLMGVVCSRSGRADEAVNYLRKALSINSNDAETHNNLGLAYKELKQFRQAKDAFERSLRLQPRQPIVLNNLGNVLAGVDQHNDAIRQFEAALKLDPNYVDCMNNLAISLREVGRLEHALAVIQHAVNIDKSRSQLYNTKGEILLRGAQYEQAREAFEQAIRLDGNIVSRINISTALKQLGDARAAVATLQEVLQVEKNNSEAHHHLGVLYEQLGDTDGAARHFRLALKYAPNHASSFYQLSKLREHSLTQAEIDKVHALLDDAQQPDIFRSSLYFALACDYEKRKEYRRSIECSLAAQRIKAARHPYSSVAVTDYIQAVQQVFPVTLDDSAPQTEDQPIPVFVVGMPRSGTTLTEQIIASHSQISGAGEVGFINELSRQASEMTKRPFPTSIQNLTVEQAQELRAVYLGRMVDRVGYIRFVVDKNPLNFNFIGFIATIFPEARILYCKRNAMDNCVSILKLPFDDNQGYSHDMSALGHYYRQHEKLMDFWLTWYAEQIFTVHYEQTVEHLERQARRMLEFIGAAYEKQVLRFFDNERLVLTPSTGQVRQPIYKSSINAWQKYGRALDPLIDALASDSQE